MPPGFPADPPRRKRHCAQNGLAPTAQIEARSVTADRFLPCHVRVSLSAVLRRRTSRGVMHGVNIYSAYSGPTRPRRDTAAASSSSWIAWLAGSGSRFATSSRSGSRGSLRTHKPTCVDASGTRTTGSPRKLSSRWTPRVLASDGLRRYLPPSGHRSRPSPQTFCHEGW